MLLCQLIACIGYRIPDTFPSTALILSHTRHDVCCMSPYGLVWCEELVCTPWIIVANSTHAHSGGCVRLWMSWNSTALNLFGPSTNWGIYPHTSRAHAHKHTRMFFFSFFTHPWSWRSRSPGLFLIKTLHLHIRDVFHIRLWHQDREILDPWFLIDTRDPRGIAKARHRTSRAEPQQPE